MTSAADVASKIPLVTVVSLETFESHRDHHILSTVHPDSTAREIEKLCGLEPSKYFYAALVEPSFGGVALVYEPGMSSARAGTANPYDTGGTLAGKCLPFADIDDRDKRRERARSLLLETLWEVPGWRGALQEYLVEFYSDPDRYVRRRCPDRSLEDAPPDLPARHEAQDADPRAWTWEVRLYSEVSLVAHLSRWACDDGTVSRLKREASSSPIPRDGQHGHTTVWRALAATPHITDIRRWDAFERLQESIEDEVLE
jgi:hypothetical protein